MASWERAYLRMATGIAVLLLVGVGLLVSRSGTKVPTTTPAASTSSSAAAKGGRNSGSQQAAPPADAAIGGFQASTGTTGAVGSGAVGGRPAGSSSSGSAAIQGAGTSGPLPNTGAPFPWWLGLIPLALGILLFAALRRGPAAATAARSRTVALDTPSYLPPEHPPQSGLGPSEDWCSPADKTGGLDDINAEFEGQRSLVGGRVF